MITNTLICHSCRGLHKNCDSDEIIGSQNAHQPVYLNVYDMYKINDYTSNIGLGVFHSGVEVYGTEYGYGGHQYNCSGIFEMEPRNEDILSEFFNMKGQLSFKQRIHIGYTNYTVEEVDIIKNKLARKFKGNKYNLIHNNCNHFSAAFTKILCKKSIPAWVNRLAHVSSFIPFLHKILPSSWQHSSLNIVT